MDTFVHLTPGQAIDEELDPELTDLVAAAQSIGAMQPISTRGSGGDDWDAPLDLRVARPRAVDLRAMWEATGQTEPPEIAAALGPNRPILLTHTMTAFPLDGRPPARVWALGYELVAHDLDADTVSVVPSNEVYRMADIGQTVDLGIELGGRLGIAGGPPGTNTALRASTSQRFQFEVSMQITLRKVVGAGVGQGSAVWKMFRQNEALDQPHTLLQTVLVAPRTPVFRCTVKTWARQAGWFGTRLGSKFWPYEDKTFEISLS
jgi:hypothetical protein